MAATQRSKSYRADVSKLRQLNGNNRKARIQIEQFVDRPFEPEARNVLSKYGKVTFKGRKEVMLVVDANSNKDWLTSSQSRRTEPTTLRT
jgi:hypothetical protein